MQLLLNGRLVTSSRQEVTNETLKWRRRLFLSLDEKMPHEFMGENRE